MDFGLSKQREKRLGNRKQKDAENEWSREKGIIMGSEMYTQSDQEEAVSVYACISVFVRKRKGATKEQLHVCTDSYLSAYKFICLCIFMCVYICGCVCRRMCAKCDVCRQ